jgi:hypothetical protein
MKNVWDWYLGPNYSAVTMWHLLHESVALFNCPPEAAAKTGAGGGCSFARAYISCPQGPGPAIFGGGF